MLKKTCRFSLLSLTVGLVSLPAQAAQIGTQVTTQTAVLTGDNNQIFQFSNQVNAPQLSWSLEGFSQAGQTDKQVTTQTAVLTGNNNQIFQFSNQVNAPQPSESFGALDGQGGLKIPEGFAVGTSLTFSPNSDPTPVPEPNSVWGNLAVGAFGTGLLVKRQLKKRRKWKSANLELIKK